jgi:hypothetical protein
VRNKVPHVPVSGMEDSSYNSLAKNWSSKKVISLSRLCPSAHFSSFGWREYKRTSYY